MTDHDMTLHHLDLRGRVRVQLLTYVGMSERKVSIVLPTTSLASDYSPRLTDRSRAPPLSSLGPGPGSEFE